MKQLVPVQTTNNRSSKTAAWSCSIPFWWKVLQSSNGFSTYNTQQITGPNWQWQHQTTEKEKKTRFCSITQFLEPIRLGCVILVWCLCVASCELQDLFDTQAHTHTHMGSVNTSVKGTTFDPNRCHSHVTSADAWIVADHVLLTQSWGFR